MSRLVEIEPGKFAHASGALWLRESRTAIIADAHLGYGWAQRRRGELGPLRDRMAQDKITALIDELSPDEAVFLGDLVHAPRPGKMERLLIEDTLKSVAARVRLTVVRGNHDRGFATDFGALGIPLAEEWRSGSVVAVHGDRTPAVENCCLVLGHLHPALRIRDAAGATQSLPVFLAGQGLIVLPAFSPFAAGWDLTRGIPGAIAQTLPTRVEALAASGTRVVRLGPVVNGRLELARGTRTGRASEWRGFGFPRFRE